MNLKGFFFRDLALWVTLDGDYVNKELAVVGLFTSGQGLESLGNDGSSRIFQTLSQEFLRIFEYSIYFIMPNN